VCDNQYLSRRSWSEQRSLLIRLPTPSQGLVNFDNRVVSAPFPVLIQVPPITEQFGFGVLPNSMAQLYLVEGSTLQPLIPATSFLANAGDLAYYVAPVTVSVPGIPEGALATLVVRIFASAHSFEVATCRAESAPFSVRLGGLGTGPANLDGLQSFTLLAPSCVPEPSTIMVGCCGAIGLLLWRRIPLQPAKVRERLR
jgi:hypothetical protein